MTTIWASEAKKARQRVNELRANLTMTLSVGSDAEVQVALDAHKKAVWSAIGLERAAEQARIGALNSRQKVPEHL